MELNSDSKFFLQNDEGDLILITEIDFDFRATQNGIIPMNGLLFEVDYIRNIIESPKEVNIQASFKIDAVYTKDY